MDSGTLAAFALELIKLSAGMSLGPAGMQSTLRQMSSTSKSVSHDTPPAISSGTAAVSATRPPPPVVG